MIVLLLYFHIQTSYGENRLVLSGGSNACEGRVDVFHDGKWGHVGPRNWNDSNSAVVCRSLKCGTVKPNGTEIGFKRYGTNIIWLDDVKCNGKEGNLWDCSFPGWNIVPSSLNSHVYVKCTRNPTLSLDGGGRCAGFVKLTVDSPTETYHVCSNGWNEAHSQKVCEELKCGDVAKSPADLIFKGTDRVQLYSCLRDDLYFWQCMDWTSTKTCKPASVTCSGHLYFRLEGDARENLCSGNLEVFNNSKWQPVSREFYSIISQSWNHSTICSQLGCGHSLIETNQTSPGVALSCSEKVTISLQDSVGQESKCYGFVLINMKSEAIHESRALCVDANDYTIGRLVCQELGCGEFMFFSVTSKFAAASQSMRMSCTGKDKSLWHCQKDRKPTRCQKAAVICSRSIEVRLTGGLDYCSGRVEIHYKGGWKRLNAVGWEKWHSDIVCTQLQCGEAYQNSTNLFLNDASMETLDLSLKGSCKKTDPIHKCLEEKSNKNLQGYVHVTCQDHHVFFTSGNSTCSGIVSVWKEGQNYVLAGEPDAWNAETAEHVCQKMRCGQLASFSRIEPASRFNEGMQLNCSGSSGCRLKRISLNSTEIAKVECTGNVTVTLTNDHADMKESKHRCWGEVQVCHGHEQKCRRVCKEAWKDENSEMLCQSLGCGSVVTIPDSIQGNRKQEPASISSVYCPKEPSSLSQCSFVVNEGSPCTKSAVHVVCSGSLELKLSDPRDKCAGKLEAFLSGSWHPVCGHKEVRDTACLQTKCGKALDEESTDTLSFSLNLSIKCLESQKCSVKKELCSSKVVRCADWSRLLVLQQESACQGQVFVKTASEHLHAISSESWGHKELKALCKSLGCGDLIKSSNISDINLKWWNKTYICPDEADTISKCRDVDQPWRENKQQLYISCQERQSISLRHHCYGEVVINGKEYICGSGWSEFMSEKLCYNLGCGKAIGIDPGLAQVSAQAHHFSCTGDEQTPLQCASQYSRCSQPPASVVCSGSLKFNLSERCGGSIQVLYLGKMRTVCLKKGLTANLLCRHFIGCGEVNNSKKIYGGHNQWQDIKLTVSCANDLHYCKLYNECAKVGLTELYCDGFIEKPPPREIPVNLIVGVSVGLFLLLIAIALVTWQRRRISNLLRGRHSFSRTTSSMASGGFEDLELQVKDQSEGWKNQANGQGKGQTSQASSEYDDVDEEADAMLSSTDEAPPLPARGGEEEDVEDGSDGYDDVDEPLLDEEEEEEEDGDKLGEPAQPEDTCVSVALDEEEDEKDHVQPDADE